VIESDLQAVSNIGKFDAIISPTSSSTSMADRVLKKYAELLKLTAP
jgi:hypothetical protein